MTCSLQWGPSRHPIQCLSSVTSALAEADQASGRGAVLEGEDAEGEGKAVRAVSSVQQLVLGTLWVSVASSLFFPEPFQWWERGWKKAVRWSQGALLWHARELGLGSRGIIFLPTSPNPSHGSFAELAGIKT